MGRDYSAGREAIQPLVATENLVSRQGMCRFALALIAA